MIKAKRGMVTDVRYSSTIEGIRQKVSITTEESDGVMVYHADWKIHGDNDLFVEGDKVSFLVDGSLVRNIRLNPFD